MLIRAIRLTVALGVAKLAGALREYADREAKRILGDDAHAGEDGTISYARPCDQCNGRGAIGPDWCSRCEGPGFDWPTVNDVGVIEALADAEIAGGAG